MKNLVMFLLTAVLSLSVAQAQFKSDEQNHPSVVNALIKPTTGLSGLLGWFNPDDFRMHHSFSLQYMASGGYGLSLATYTNSMMYRLADPLDVRFDVSLQGSPFGPSAQGEFSRLYLSRAELNYRPWENVRVQFQFRQFPYGSYSPYYDYPSSFRNLGEQ